MGGGRVNGGIRRRDDASSRRRLGRAAGGDGYPIRASDIKEKTDGRVRNYVLIRIDIRLRF